MKKLILCTAVVAALGTGVSTSASAALASNATLNFNPGIAVTTYVGSPVYANVTTVKQGSYFAMGVNKPTKRVALVENNGLLLGTSQTASGSHGGAPGCAPTGLSGDTCTNTVPNGELPGIDKAWAFFGATGMHQSTSPTTVLTATGNTATVDFSGWSVSWNGIASIPMGAGATAGNANGVADITCAVDCAVGDTYTLDYSATVPLGDPSNFGGTPYFLHLVGSVAAAPSAVPVPAAVWLFGSGLLGLVGVARRKKSA